MLLVDLDRRIWDENHVYRKIKWAKDKVTENGIYGSGNH